MDKALWFITLQLSYFHQFALALVIVALVVFVLGVVLARCHKWDSVNAWKSVGKRFAGIGWMIILSVFVVYLAGVSLDYARLVKVREAYAVSLTEAMKAHFTRTLCSPRGWFIEVEMNFYLYRLV